MKYNAEYDRWVTKGGLVYRYSKRQNKLILCKLSDNGFGYLIVNVSKPKRRKISVHILVFETFIGKVNQGYELDHQNTIRDDNRLDNLRLVTHRENCNNPLTIKHFSEAHKGKHSRGVTFSEFGKKFKEHFGITKLENPKLYDKEYHWFKKHGRCRWE